MAYVRTDLAGYDGWLDSLKSAASSVIKPKTIVGRLLGGDVKGAATGTVKLLTGGAQPSAQAQPIPDASLVSPGGFVERYQMPLIIGAGALALFLVMGRRRGRR